MCTGPSREALEQYRSEHPEEFQDNENGLSGLVKTEPIVITRPRGTLRQIGVSIAAVAYFGAGLVVEAGRQIKDICAYYFEDYKRKKDQTPPSE